jgi:adenosylcobinamide kinase / adenosylcobinamide-phosphate guanylyltransferase
MSITLVIGGARSGKSRFAERLAFDPKIYLATAQAFDDEMRLRIAKHQEQRSTDWQTYDAPLELAETLQHADGPRRFILIDCITLWLSNILLEGHDWEAELEKLLLMLGRAQADVVIVSNEVGLGIVPDTPLGRVFRDAQGIANQALAEVAETVVLMAAGLPLALKGEVPRGEVQGQKSKRPKSK